MFVFVLLLWKIFKVHNNFIYDVYTIFQAFECIISCLKYVFQYFSRRKYISEILRNRQDDKAGKDKACD